ncbi:DUF6894 family protein [Methylobacterium sp. HMF5984]|uniref:DUF6894 family protein n=1 Tax=Methylobacterium sp. HMF5984 TaxID=3367370 RepID=UPI0038536C7B
MPRYYFNVYDGVDSLDNEGIELVSMRVAGVEAIRFAGELFKAKAEQLLGGKPWHMEVMDEQGLLILRLDLSLTGFLLKAPVL